MNVRHNKIEALLQCNLPIFRLHYLNPAMDKGYVRFLYVESPNKPEQAYFVTKEGMVHLREFKEQQGRSKEEE